LGLRWSLVSMSTINIVKLKMEIYILLRRHQCSIHDIVNHLIEGIGVFNKDILFTTSRLESKPIQISIVKIWNSCNLFLNYLMISMPFKFANKQSFCFYKFLSWAHKNSGQNKPQTTWLDGLMARWCTSATDLVYHSKQHNVFSARLCDGVTR